MVKNKIALLFLVLFLTHNLFSQELKVDEILYNDPFSVCVVTSSYRMPKTFEIQDQSKFEDLNVRGGKFDYLTRGKFSSPSYFSLYNVDPGASEVKFCYHLKDQYSGKDNGVVYKDYIIKYIPEIGYLDYRDSHDCIKMEHYLRVYSPKYSNRKEGIREKIEVVYLNKLPFWKFDIKIIVMDELTEMPISDAKIQMTMKKMWSPNEDSKKFFYETLKARVHREFGLGRVKEGYSYTFTTNEKGMVSSTFAPNFEGEYEIYIYARAANRKPIKKTIEGKFSKYELLDKGKRTVYYKITWPRLPSNVIITDEIGNPTFERIK